MEINKHQLIEGIGFGLEVLCFILCGFFIHVNLIAMIMFFICGMCLAVFVGERIKDNVRMELKRNGKR